ncbi:MAG: hypothetical protein MJ252_11040, partial [archaeon]|nr:hypothetical protein [archaeon]
MKFLKFLKEETITEWKDFYIDYISLLELINKSKEKIKKEKEMQESDSTTKSTLLEKLIDDEEGQDLTKELRDNFLEIYELEVKKFRFFSHEQICIREKKRFDEIIEQLEYIRVNKEYHIFSDQLENIFKAFYRDVSTFQNFIKTNLKINEKIISKFNKYLKGNDTLSESIFNNCLEIIQSAENLNKKLLDETEKRFCFYFYDKYNSHPMEVLKNYIVIKRISGTQACILCIVFACMIFLLFGCIVIGQQNQIDTDNDPEFRSIFPMFRTFGILCLYLWLLGVAVWAWEGANINYKALFKFDNHFSNIIDIFKRCSFFSVLLLVTILLYLLTRSSIQMFHFLDKRLAVDALPLLCWCSILIYFFMPFKIFNYEGRIYTMKLFLESVASIFIHIEFRHIWFMDQLTSLIGPMRDFEYFFCYYSYFTETIDLRQKYCANNRGIYLAIGIFPNFIRILQCARVIKDSQKVFPQIFNIGKYSFNIIVCTFSFLTTLNNDFFFCWIGAAFISGCYSSFWDIVMDFGFFEKGPNFPLRNKLAYKNHMFYYVAIVVNVILRFLWVLSVSPEIMEKLIRPEFLGLILYLLEMIRRGQWNFIRVEYEQLDLIKKFQISYYEDLPFIKRRNKFFVNFENLYIFGFDKKEKIKLQIKEIYGEHEMTGNYRYSTKVSDSWDEACVRY